MKWLLLSWITRDIHQIKLNGTYNIFFEQIFQILKDQDFQQHTTTFFLFPSTSTLTYYYQRKHMCVVFVYTQFLNIYNIILIEDNIII